ncbi:hypothetical protein [Bordetella sp. LUAb4]|uniref:hypothetical protein n=1 Tax=Bordetella sp. LUAb4 TaxID=2843195 RepID=UPI001E39F58C|nr:hypothetical protein [Bordetella sp. LUAb4]
MGQLQSIFSCVSCSRSNVANSDFADPPYGTIAATTPMFPGRARARSGSAGSIDTQTPSISNTEASSDPRASRRRSLSATAEMGAAAAMAFDAGAAAAKSALVDTAIAASMGYCRVGKNTFSIPYLRTLAAWAQAGESGSWHARMECAPLVLCMEPDDVLIQRDDGKLEFLVKSRKIGSADYFVIPVPWPKEELRLWPPVPLDHDAKTALAIAYPGWLSTAADGTSLSCSGPSVGSSAASTPNIGRRAERVADADKFASARPPLPREQAWADYGMLDAALHSSPGDNSAQHISNIARKQIRNIAYLVRSKHPMGLKFVSHLSVRLPALIEDHKAPSPLTVGEMPSPRTVGETPWTAANISNALEFNRVETAWANGEITRRDSLRPTESPQRDTQRPSEIPRRDAQRLSKAPFSGARTNPAFLMGEDPLDEVNVPRPPSAQSDASGVDI